VAANDDPMELTLRPFPYDGSIRVPERLVKYEPLVYDAVGLPPNRMIQDLERGTGRTGSDTGDVS
jgi:hypothetical protein